MKFFQKDGSLISPSKFKMLCGLKGDFETFELVNRFKDVLKIEVTFDCDPVESIVLDISEKGVIVQTVLPVVMKFDDKQNLWKDSSIRKEINSDDFIGMFNKEFTDRIVPSDVHTEDYITEDKLWLLSHDEIGCDDEIEYDSFNLNKDLKCFKFYDRSNRSIRMRYTHRLICWWLRSACSMNNYIAGYTAFTGGLNLAYVSSHHSVCPATLISL